LADFFLKFPHVIVLEPICTQFDLTVAVNMRLHMLSM